MTRRVNATEASPVPADGQFHLVVGTNDNGVEMAIARNARQVALRDVTDHSKTVVLGIGAWTAFIDWLKAGGSTLG